MNQFRYFWYISSYETCRSLFCKSVAIDLKIAGRLCYTCLDGVLHIS